MSKKNRFLDRKPKRAPNDLRLSDLTRGEKLYLMRRRDNWSQAMYADYYGVSLRTYRGWESGEVEKGIPYISLGKLTKAEICTILRRRAGQGVQELADEIGVSRWWVTQMERGTAPLDALAQHWDV